ncbi:MAG: DUF2147 domain-containing protein [Flavobacteriales bacterium]|nr:DUF2147 domain-containing protein [Flavobacteriales bacterium]
MRTKISFLAALLFLTASINAQGILGKWKTVDDETGKTKSVVEIFQKGDKVYGKIVELLNREAGDEDPLCDKCTDDRLNKHIVGMEIIRAMEKDDEKYEEGTIMDPGNGKIYDCKMWVDEDDSKVLKVRGYISFFYRTQTWHRVE